MEFDRYVSKYVEMIDTMSNNLDIGRGLASTITTLLFASMLGNGDEPKLMFRNKQGIEKELIPEHIGTEYLELFLFENTQKCIEICPILLNRSAFEMTMFAKSFWDVRRQEECPLDNFINASIDILFKLNLLLELAGTAEAIMQGSEEKKHATIH